MTRSRLVVAFASVLAVSPALAQDNASARFIDAGGSATGSATLTQTTGGVLIEIEVSGLPAGQWVAFHIHETGKCGHADGHKAAGGHFNPTGAEHGYLAAKGPHAGDMPNQRVGEDGTLRAQVINSAVALDGGTTAIRGKALMIHGGIDDYRSQPAGNAGDRKACAVIE